MNSLHSKHCVPCEGGTKPLTDSEEKLYMRKTQEWQILTSSPHTITREFQFQNFKKALEFINKVGEIAEQEGHHPDIKLFNYKHVEISLTTHAIGGLSVNDFILASKVDRIKN